MAEAKSYNAPAHWAADCRSQWAVTLPVTCRTTGMEKLLTLLHSSESFNGPPSCFLFVCLFLVKKKKLPDLWNPILPLPHLFLIYLFLQAHWPLLCSLNLLSTLLPQILSPWPLIQVGVTLTLLQPLFKCHILCDIYSDHLFEMYLPPNSVSLPSLFYFSQ